MVASLIDQKNDIGKQNSNSENLENGSLGHVFLVLQGYK